VKSDYTWKSQPPEPVHLDGELLEYTDQTKQNSGRKESSIF
jgi:hypothetical protein